MSATENHARERRVLRLRVLLSVILAVAAVVLGNRWVDQVDDDPVDVLEAGTLQPLAARPYGQEHIVKLPTSDVIVNVGAPVRTLDQELVKHGSTTSGHDVRAPDGGTLLPLSWAFAVRDADGFQDPEPITLRLVVDTETVELESVSAKESDNDQLVSERRYLLPLDQEIETDDLLIEVEYDGVTQVLHVGSGEIDADRAQPLYETDRFLNTGCEVERDGCPFAATSAADGLTPLQGRLLVESISLHAWDPELGWADDGTLWASVQIRCAAPDARVASGAFLPNRTMTAPKVTLADQQPVRRVGLTATRIGYSSGQLVFAVPADQAPGKLVVRTTLTFKGGVTMPVRATTNLEPAP